MNFTYVLSGWEDSTNDARVYNDAIARHNFKAPPGSGQYYLEDGGYANTDLYILPYQYMRYHLKEQAQACLLYTSPSPRDRTRSRMPSSA